MDLVVEAFEPLFEQHYNMDLAKTVNAWIQPTLYRTLRKLMTHTDLCMLMLAVFLLVHDAALVIIVKA